MSILDKISSMFGSKGKGADEPIATPVEPATPAEPMAPSAPAEPPASEPVLPDQGGADINPQPGVITPEGEAPAEPPAEEKSGEGSMNLGA